MNLRAAIFDMDGTLLDTNDAWIQLIPNGLKRYGVELSPEELAAISVQGFDLICARAVKYLPDVSPEQFKGELLDTIDAFFSHDARLKPGAGEYLLDLYARGIPMCVATMSDLELAEKAFSRLGVLHCFKFIRSGADKHSPDVFIECAARLGLEPCRCAVFEDSVKAARMARDAGCTVVAVDDQSPSRMGIRDVCHIYIEDFRELLSGKKSLAL